MAVMVLATLALGLGFAQQALADTPEWVAYQDAVRPLTSYSVRFRCVALSKGGTSAPRRDAWGSLTVEGEKFVVDLPGTRQWWDGRLATTLDKRSGRLTRNAAKPELPYFGLFGLPDPTSIRGWKPGHLLRLTREGGRGETAPVSVGWRAVIPWLDTRDTFEMWFDPTTHLLASFTELYEGMRNPSRVDYDLEWDLKPSIPNGFFTPKPVADKDDMPVSNDRYRFRPSARPIEGLGTLVVRAPKGVAAHLEIGGSFDANHMELDGTSATLTARLQPGRHAFNFGEATMAVPIAAGYDTIVELGAVRSIFPTEVCLTQQLRHDEYRLSKGATILVLPGPYVVAKGKRRIPVMVKGGQTLSVGP